jgi:hypothetical protein
MEEYTQLFRGEARRGGKIGIWRLQEVRENNEQGICPIC